MESDDDDDYDDDCKKSSMDEVRAEMCFWGWGWRVLPGMELPSSGEREAEHREAQHQLSQLTWLFIGLEAHLCFVHTFIFSILRTNSTTIDLFEAAPCGVFGIVG